MLPATGSKFSSGRGPLRLIGDVSNNIALRGQATERLEKPPNRLQKRTVT